MSGWLDTLFGNLPPMPTRPSSRAAMPGLQPYQQMPDPKASVTDERGQTDQAFWMRNYYPQTNAGKYRPSLAGVSPDITPKAVHLDPTESVGSLIVDDDGTDQGYKPSFQQNWRPPYSSQAAYRPSPVVHNKYGDDIGPMGPPWPPRGPTGTSVDPQMPYMGPHLPISPGDPGWTSPPSASGPHNPGGDPARPGYGNPQMPMDFSSPSSPQPSASQPSYQQMIDFLQSWRGGTS